MAIQCPVCGKSIDEAAIKAATGQTKFGAQEVDPTVGTRQFFDDKWYYFDSIQCRSKFVAEHKES